jgi:hypothetical protein
MTGCSFAGLAANREGGILMAPFPGMASVTKIDEVLEYAGTQRLPAIIVLPGIRTESQLVDQLLVLAAGDRWRVFRVPTPTGLDTDDVFVGLEWLTATPELWSSPMGLAPLGTMPPTRKAPYTCIAAWTGERLNRFRKGTDPVVHFLDADLTQYRLNDKKYDKHRAESVTATRAMLLTDKARNYRNVAFRLSAAVAGRLEALPVTTVP